MTTPGPGKGGQVRPGLDRDVRHLVSIAALAVLGREAELERYLRIAVESGVPLSGIREILLQVIPFAGFPRAQQAFDRLVRVETGRGDTRPGEGTPERVDGAVLRERGEEHFRKVHGEHADAILRRLRNQSHEATEWVLTDAYGKGMVRPGLDARVRELAAVAMLLALDLPVQLMGHMRGAVRCGSTPDEVREVVSQLSLHLPDVQVDAGLLLADKAFG